MKPQVILLALSALTPLSAKITLAPLFADHAVLQRDKPVAVWGVAQPGERVAVQFHGLSAAATADTAGAWKTELPTLPATSSGEDLTVSAPGEDPVTLHDVVVGEVWLCSGQSNMEFIVNAGDGATFQVNNAAAEVAAANYPLIRQFAVRKQVAAAPQSSVAGGWAPCSPATVSHFTAAGYFFARDIFRRLSVPVGIIDSTWGGTPVESWMSRAALDSDPAFAVVDRRWQQAVAAFPQGRAAYEIKLAEWKHAGEPMQAADPGHYKQWLAAHPQPRLPTGSGDKDPYLPAGLYNGMIAPLAPYALRGMLWYQGEANASRPSEYHRLFAAMITNWRVAFGQGDLPFYWVQLASFESSPGWPFLREAQQQALSLPNTGQALAIDIGERHNIHPRNKQEVGRRLALIAANQVYGIPVKYSGPVFASAAVEGAAMRVRFTAVENGLVAQGTVATCELAGTDHVFRPATASIEGNTLLVKSDLVAAPVAVRYAWKPFAEGHLYNSVGLPAAPFRSDRW